MREQSEEESCLVAVRELVCIRCISTLTGTPPCENKEKGCGIELYFPKLVEIYHSVDSCLIHPYFKQFRKEVCADCELRSTKLCPCPLFYLFPLAVEAVEEVDRGRRTQP